MNELNSYEYAVAQKAEGPILLKRIALIATYVLTAALLMGVGILTRLLVPLLALMPLAVWVMVFVTWRYVSVEFEYSIVSGVFTLSKIYGRRSRKKMLSVPVKAMTLIAPYNHQLPETLKKAEENIARFSPSSETEAVSSFSSPDIYYALYVDPDTEEKRVIWFEATSKCLKVMKFYNSVATVMSEVRY